MENPIKRNDLGGSTLFFLETPICTWVLMTSLNLTPEGDFVGKKRWRHDIHYCWWPKSCTTWDVWTTNLNWSRIPAINRYGQIQVFSNTTTTSDQVSRIPHSDAENAPPPHPLNAAAMISGVLKERMRFGRNDSSFQVVFGVTPIHTECLLFLRDPNHHQISICVNKNI